MCLPLSYNFIQKLVATNIFLSREGKEKCNSSPISSFAHTIRCGFSFVVRMESKRMASYNVTYKTAL